MKLPVRNGGTASTCEDTCPSKGWKLSGSGALGWFAEGFGEGVTCCRITNMLS
ncbi:MAG TPA: hypothetical protein VKB77_02340 [Terriglobales bacterium]|nr:hypothetical protein [Terriglobales bacterium]